MSQTVVMPEVLNEEEAWRQVPPVEEGEEVAIKRKKTRGVGVRMSSQPDTVSLEQTLAQKTTDRCWTLPDVVRQYLR